MDVRLSSEQQALQDAAAQLADRMGPGTVGQLAERERTDKLDAAVAASGWRELRTTEDGGPPLGSGVEAAVIAEEFGRRLVDTPYLGPTLAADLRRLAGVPAATSVETVALDRSHTGLAVAVDGAAPPATLAVDAAGAGRALLLVPTPAGHVLAAVGLQPADDRPDLTRPVATAEPGAAVTPLEGMAHPLTGDQLAAWTALGLALTCADLVGTMRGAVELSVDYASARRQFGRPVGSFQAVQHLLADAHVLTEGARSVSRHAAWAVDALPVDAALDAAAVAKAYCARAALAVCETAIQVHGGIGNTWECLAHVHLRRALLSTEILGGADVNIGRVLAHRGIGGGRGLR